jgi:hypothetical protein
METQIGENAWQGHKKAKEKKKHDSQLTKQL